MSVYHPPKAKKWKNAERWEVGLWDNKYSLCGQRLLWVLIGHKWVHMAAPVCETKMKMTRKEWDKLKSKERYHTDEDIEIYKAKRKKIWDEAQAKRLEVEKFMRENPGVNNTKRRRKRRTKVS